MVRRRILIYGGTGYTGRLIVEHARKLRRSPIVAGRSADRVQALAARLGVSGAWSRSTGRTHSIRHSTMSAS